MASYTDINWPIGAKISFYRNGQTYTGTIEDRTNTDDGLVYYVFVEWKTYVVSPTEITSWG